MACAHPLKLKPTVYVRGSPRSWREYVSVPCGYCVNCRRDQQNYWVDRAEYEYCKRLTASFVTLTYDDVHLVDECWVKDIYNHGLYDIASDGQKVPRTTLVYHDIERFLNNLRHYIRNNYSDSPNLLIQPDFSYLYCGEYGEDHFRCHFHILFFGLDFAACGSIFRKLWKKGFVDVLPLLDGGIRYVCKYMDKFEKGDFAFYKYDCKDIARPRLRASIGFGKDLLRDNAENIIDNYYTYACGKGKRRPISAYWKKLLTGCAVSRDVTKVAWDKKCPVYEAIRTKAMIQTMREYNLKDFRKEKIDEFRLEQSRKREYNIILQLRRDGSPSYDPGIDIEKCVRPKYEFLSYDRKKIIKIPHRAQRCLAEEYQHYLLDKWLNDNFAI